MAISVEVALKKKFGEVRKGRGRNGIEYKVKCPFCGGKWKLYINPTHKDGVYNCYKCSESGQLSNLVGDIARVEAQQQFVNQEVPLPQDVPPPGVTVPLTDLPPENIGIQYLTAMRKRAFDPTEITNLYGVRFCTQGRQYVTPDFTYDTTNTLIFPVWMHNKCVGWQSRLLYTPDDMNDDQKAAAGFTRDSDGKWQVPPKYWTSPGFQKGRVLWNFDQARRYKFVVPTEGVFDSMAVGLPGVCTFGTGISDSQASMIKSYWEAAIILLDPDGTEAQVQELVDKLYRAITVVPVVLTGGYKDPGDTQTQEIWRQIVANIDYQISINNTLALQDLRRYVTGE